MQEQVFMVQVIIDGVLLLAAIVIGVWSIF